MAEKYFMLSRCEDEVMVNEFNKKTLTEWLNGDVNLEGIKFLKCIPYDLNYFPSMSAVIIKGNAIIPEPVDRITEYKVE